MPSGFSDAQLLGGLALIALLALVGGWARLVRLKQALGLEQLLAGGFLFLPLGMLLSEAGLGVVNRAVVRELDPLVTLGLGMLGLLMGLRLEIIGPRQRTILASAAMESLSTIVLVGAPLFVLLDIVSPADLQRRATAAAVLGCVAAISGGHSLGAVVRRASPGQPDLVTRVADQGTVAAVLVAGVLVALLSPTATLVPLERLLALATIGIVGGLCTWLLSRGTSDAALRGAFQLGMLLVTAGTAAYLSLPPVAATLLAGMTIAQVSGSLARELSDSLGFLEPPLTVLLLVIAGAALRMPTWRAGVVLGFFLVLRTAGKILGGRAASAVSKGELPRLMGLGLLPSGAVALGLALDYAHSARGRLGAVAVAVAVLGLLLSETAGVWTTRLLARAKLPESTPPPTREKTP